MIPSTYSYTGIKFPWGSCPATDYLFGSGETPCWHDGAAFNKLSKVRTICHHEAVQKDLRVCWEGEQIDRNCGVCFKCVATQICFWLSGVERPACFGDGCGLDRVAETYLKKSPQNIALFQLFEKEARACNMPELAAACAHALGSQKSARLKRNLRRVFRR